MDPFHYSLSHILQMLSPNESFTSAGSNNFFLHPFIHFLHCLVKEVALPTLFGDLILKNCCCFLQEKSLLMFLPERRPNKLGLTYGNSIDGHKQIKFHAGLSKRSGFLLGTIWYSKCSIVCFI